MEQNSLTQLDSKLRNSNLPLNKINSLMKFIEKNLGCDKECKREREIERLRKNWKESEQKLKDLPDIVENNEKKFFVLKNGEDYYRNNILLKRYEEYIREWKKEQLSKLAEMQNKIDPLLRNFSTLKLAKTRLEQLHKQLVERNRKLKLDVDNFYKETFTSQRRVYYQIEDNDNLQYYRFFIKIIYYGIILGYILFGGFFREKHFKNWRIVLLLLIYLGLPFIINYILFYLLVIYRLYNENINLWR